MCSKGLRWSTRIHFADGSRGSRATRPVPYFEICDGRCPRLQRRRSTAEAPAPDFVSTTAREGSRTTALSSREHTRPVSIVRRLSVAGVAPGTRSVARE